MGRVREHIDDACRLENVTLFMYQRTCIAGQSTGMTGHIDDAFRPEQVHSSNYFGGAAAGRVEQKTVAALAHPSLAAVDPGKVGDTKRYVIEPVTMRIRRGPRSQRRLALDAEDRSCPARKRQGKIADAAKEIDDAMVRRHVELLDREVHHALVDFGVHLVANTNMMRAVKAVTTNRGRDTRDFAMFAASA